tara:strand:- start:438 stop:638 length:201 start_codon:yes stop_codon:yes gene_type:complete
MNPTAVYDSQNDADQTARGVNKVPAINATEKRVDADHRRRVSNINDAASNMTKARVVGIENPASAA